MAQIFISYSRADAQFISDFVPLLHEAYGVASVFYDEQIPGGTKWWEMILREIATCDLFIYLCSNESLQSPYCQSELREAVRLQKQILPVIVRPKTNYPFAGVDYGTAIPDDVAIILQDTNCIDLSRGFRDRDSGPRASAKLYRGINEALRKAPATPQHPLTPYPTAQPQVNDKKKRSWLNEPRAIIIAAVITGVFAIIAVVIPLINNGQNPSQRQETPTPTFSPSPTTQEIAAATSFPSEMPAPTIAPSDTSNPTNTPTLTSSPTSTPSITPDLTLTAQYLEGQFTQMTEAFLREQSTDQSASMTSATLSWTPTFTLTHTVRPTDRPSATLRPTQRATSIPNNSEVTINVASANFRSGPGTNYSVVGSASQNEQFRIIARISDSSWYLIEQATGELAWIWSGIVDVNVSDSQIEVVATVPATPIIIASSQPDTAESTAPCIPPMINNGQRGIYQDGGVFTGDPNNYNAAQIGQINSADVFMRISLQYICTQNVSSNGYTSYTGWIYVRIIQVVSGSDISVGSLGWIPITLTDDSGYQSYLYTSQ